MPTMRNGRALWRWLAGSLVTLLVIAYLTLFGLMLAERGRQGAPAPPLEVAGEALTRTLDYIVHHPASYRWHRYDVAALKLVGDTVGRSVGLLAVSLGLALIVGVPLGVVMALARRRGGSLFLALLSVLGVSTPSFLLAMLFWAGNIALSRALGTTSLPAAGFGWDKHLILPALTLAARPLAQIARVACIAFSEAMGEDYVRVAQAKGLTPLVVRGRHILRNAWVPIITTLSTSLRFSLASLPVVEYFFNWSGIGAALLEAIQLGMLPLATDLILSLGLLFLVINFLLELLYPALDPRLRSVAQEQEPPAGWGERLTEVWGDLTAWLRGLRARLRRDGAPRPAAARPAGGAAPATQGRAGAIWGQAARNPELLIGAVMVIGLIALALFGARLTPANPYELHGVMVVEGEIGAPPYAPSATFPWGTDHLGRDVQALVLAGARQTLSLAFFAMLARVLLGATLGVLAGWGAGGWLDRLVTGAIGVWAAFPVTLFAMILIQALGIQQGTSVFIVALCVVGWGEVAQLVRGLTLKIRPQQYIEAARAMGAGPARLLTQHVVPNLLPALLTLAVLEMGGVLMLLAELGFLNVFLGGGFKVMYAETGRMLPVIAYFSDVPEWGALLANIRDWWKSCPWMAWYPGAAFFLAIVAFNVWGEGLRRFLAECRLNVGRLLNRYTLAALVIATFGLIWFLRGAAPLGVYQAQARQFDTEQAMGHIRELSAPAYQGREAGTAGAEAAARYIAQQMEAIGLQPAGEKETFFQKETQWLYYLQETPRLELLDAGGQVVESFTYHEHFVELGGPYGTLGDFSGPIIGVALGPDPESAGAAPQAALMNRIGLKRGGKLTAGQRSLRMDKRVILIHERQAERLNIEAAGAVLVVSEDSADLRRRYAYAQVPLSDDRRVPTIVIGPAIAERLLATAGSSLAELERMGAGLAAGEAAATSAGATVHLQTNLVGNFFVPLFEIEKAKQQTIFNVLGFIPGSGSFEENASGRGIDSQVILISAYYDGLGVAPDGTLYPGANDNASGVALLLELARALKQGPYAPKKTVVFAVWGNGERYDGLSVVNMMNAKPGFDQLEVEAVIELSGVGAGAGDALALGQGSSFRLTQLVQSAGQRLGVDTTTRGRGPHFGFYSRPGHGERSALSAYVSWDGSDAGAHRPADAFEAIDAAKLRQAGQLTTLVATVLSREQQY